MKDWKDECNFRRITGEDGIERYYIIVDKQHVEVSHEVYEMYSASVNHERHAEKFQVRNGFLSLEKMAEDEMKLEYVCSDVEDSSEDVFFARLANSEREATLSALYKIISSLPEEDRELIDAVILKGIGVREYARQKGVYHRAIVYRRDRILAKIKENFKNS